MIANPVVPPVMPTTIHGRRLPKREVVRSDSRPQKALPINAHTAPTRVTCERSPLTRAAGTSAPMRSVSPSITGVSRATQIPISATR